MAKNQNLYFIAIMPHHELQNEVTSFKNYIKEKYFSRAALNSPPHITLFPPFKWEEENEKILSKSLSAFVQNRQIFNVDLNGFDRFSHRVIFIKPILSHPLNRLQEELAQHLKSLNLINPDEKRIYLPHMTIANRDLKKNLFYPVWNEFKENDFKRSFEVNSIVLLKHNGKFWDIFQEFKFRG